MNKNNMMSVLMSSFVAFPVVSIQWFVWGYSLAFAPEGGSFIGNMHYAGMDNVVTSSASYPNMPTVPNIAFSFFQMMFAVITPAIIFSGASERMRMGAFMIFLIVWSTLIYDFIAYWAWAPNGWFSAMGGFDTSF